MSSRQRRHVRNTPLTGTATPPWNGGRSRLDRQAAAEISAVDARSKRGASWSKRDNPPVLTLKFTLTRGEVGKILRQRMIRRWQFGAGVVGVLFVLACGIQLSDALLITIGVILVLLEAVYDTVGLPWLYWRRFEVLHSEHAVTINDDGITSERARSSSQTEWAFWSEVQVLPDAYLVIAGRQTMMMIPKRAFTASDDEFLFQQIVSRHLHTSFATAA